MLYVTLHTALLQMTSILFSSLIAISETEMTPERQAIRDQALAEQQNVQRRLKAREYYYKNKERILQLRNESAKKEVTKETSKLWYEENKERVLKKYHEKKAEKTEKTEKTEEQKKKKKEDNKLWL